MTGWRVGYHAVVVPNDVVERCRIGSDIVCGVLEALPCLKVRRPDAAFYAYFSVEGAPDSLALAKRLVDEALVGVAFSTAFGEGSEGFLRLLSASSPKRLRIAVERMASALR